MPAMSSRSNRRSPPGALGITLDTTVGPQNRPLPTQLFPPLHVPTETRTPRSRFNALRPRQKPAPPALNLSKPTKISPSDGFLEIHVSPATVASIQRERSSQRLGRRSGRRTSPGLSTISSENSAGATASRDAPAVRPTPRGRRARPPPTSSVYSRAPSPTSVYSTIPSPDPYRWAPGADAPPVPKLPTANLSHTSLDEPDDLYQKTLDLLKVPNTSLPERVSIVSVPATPQRGSGWWSKINPFHSTHVPDQSEDVQPIATRAADISGTEPTADNVSEKYGADLIGSINWSPVHEQPQEPTLTDYSAHADRPRSLVWSKKSSRGSDASMRSAVSIRSKFSTAPSAEKTLPSVPETQVYGAGSYKPFRYWNSDAVSGDAPAAPEGHAPIKQQLARFSWEPEFAQQSGLMSARAIGATSRFPQQPEPASVAPSFTNSHSRSVSENSKWSGSTWQNASEREPEMKEVTLNDEKLEPIPSRSSQQSWNQPTWNQQMWNQQPWAPQPWDAAAGGEQSRSFGEEAAGVTIGALTIAGKMRQCWQWLTGIAFLLLVAIVVGVTVPLILKNQHSHATDSTAWLNLTAYPPVPTGVAAIPLPTLLYQNAGCVNQQAMWSCSLPKEDQSSNSTGQPSFRVEIAFQNNSLATANAQIASKRDFGSMARSHMLARATMKELESSLAYTPNPAAPSSQDQKFLGETTDNNTLPWTGETTPFYISLLPTNPQVADDDLTAPNAELSTLQSATQAASSSSNPSTAPSASLYPLAHAQPLNLYNRGQDSEHYGFYSYYTRSIFLQSDTFTSAAPNAASLNANGGAPHDKANVVCLWPETRFKMQLWTRAGTASTTSGDMPYPVTVTMDRHGGDPTMKGVACYGLDKNGNIIKGQARTMGEDRAFDGQLVDAATQAFGGQVGPAGGIDGGTGGCECQWGTRGA